MPDLCIHLDTFLTSLYSHLSHTAGSATAPVLAYDGGNECTGGQLFYPRAQVVVHSLPGSDHLIVSYCNPPTRSLVRLLATLMAAVRQR
jgi:hypothetical protein